MIDARIHISYSEKHYSPRREPGEKFHYSCSQTAYHLWNCLRHSYERVTYGDAVPKNPIDLLWTQRDHRGFPNVGRIVFLATGANHRAANQALVVAQREVGRPSLRALLDGRELHSWSAIWDSYRTAARSEITLVKGNECVREGYLRYAQSYGDRFAMIDNGALPEIHRDLGPRDRTDTFVYSATRFCLRKGAHIIAPAWCEFSREHPEARLLLLGRPGDYPLVESLAGARGVEHIGEFVSGSADYVATLNRATWVILPSLAEGQAGTLLEAMSAGCLPIASRESGIDAEKYGGIALEPNTPANLVACLKEACNEKVPRAQDALRERLAAQHSWKVFEERVLKVTSKLLSEAPRRRQSGPRIAWNFARDWLRSLT